MLKYIVRRSMMILPTLLGISILSFAIINLAPGSPVEQKIMAMRFGGGMEGSNGHGSEMGVSAEVVEALKKQYGFDKPIHIRYLIWLKNIVYLDFGDSFRFEEPVTSVIASKLPVSLQFGVVSLILTYLICIPLGLFKAVHDGSKFDMVSSFSLILAYSIPPLILAVLLRVYFAGGRFLDWFPIGDLYSDSYQDLSFWGKIEDRIHHFVLPLICYVIGNFTVLTFLMKNSLLEEIKLDYIRTARAKGLPERLVIYKHALRNALIPIATGLASFLSFFFAGSVIIEQVFNLDGMGQLSYQSALDRDYNVLMGLIFFQSLMMLVGRFLSDLSYTLIDPRIDFS
ncbi:MAG: ABC transporter permease subunit [Bdellovibrionales bacterium]|nr:ABC transporter permease subunit [Bdellovibrionales bacterium]